MALLDELKARKQELLKQMESIDSQAAEIKKSREEQLTSLRSKRIPLEEHLRLIDQMIKTEGGK